MGFDEKAAGWDTEKRVERAKLVAAEIAKELGLKSAGDATAMEFGCGTGLVSFFLRDRFKQIILIDSSKGMIDVMNQKIRDAGLENMTALCMDICAGTGENAGLLTQNSGTARDGAERGASEQAPEMIGPTKFDVIYTSMVLHHIKNTDTVLERLSGLLEPGGWLCIADLNEEDGSFHRKEEGFDGHNGFDPVKLKAKLEQKGFRNMTGRVFYKGEKIIDEIAVPYSLFIMTGQKGE